MIWPFTLFFRRRPKIFTRPERTVNRVFIHCSASDNPKHDDVSVIRKWHKERGFADVGYHFYIKKDGEIQPGRNIEATPAAQAPHNQNTIAICCGGLKDFTESQFTALRRICREIHDEIPEATFHGHCEVSDKTCPVFDYKKVLNLDFLGKMII